MRGKASKKKMMALGSLTKRKALSIFGIVLFIPSFEPFFARIKARSKTHKERSFPASK